MLKTLKLVVFVMFAMALIVPSPAVAATPTSLNAFAIPGLCPSWASASAAPSISGVKWQRSGNRKIFIEWSLSPTNLEGKPVVRRFTSDEEQQIRSAIAWWDSVFDTVDFREMSGDYASLKIGTRSGIGFPQSQYWYLTRAKTIQRAWIAVPAETEDTGRFMGYKLNPMDIRKQIGYLLGLASIVEPSEVVQSRLRNLYGENSCYPQPIGASWDPANGLRSEGEVALVGSTQRIRFNYAGLSQIGVTVLTPSVCSASNFAASPGSGLAVSITSQGICAVLAQVREGRYPPSSEVLVVKTGFGQTILTNSVPKRIKAGKPFRLKVATNSGLPVRISNVRPNVCKVVNATLTGINPGKCTLILHADEASIGQMRFVKSMKTINLTVTK